MPGIACSTDDRSAPVVRPAPPRDGDVVVVSMRAEDAPAFLASLRALLPESAVILAPVGTVPEIGERDGSRRRPALTERQREVLDLLMDGLSNKEIARRLALSHFTVRNHVSQILRSFDVSTRREAEARGRASGRVEPAT